MLGIMLRALLHCVIFTLLIPFKIVVLIWMLVEMTINHFRGIMTFRESWGYFMEGAKMAFEADMDIIRNGF